MRIGVLTGGGDCPGLNAVIRAVAKAAAKRGWETIGFLGGYEGILDNSGQPLTLLACSAANCHTAPAQTPKSEAALRGSPVC